jgi:uncharacterized protein (TIGR03437 family)
MRFALALIVLAAAAVAQTCTSFSLNPLSQIVGAAGGSGTITVNTTPSVCSSSRTAVSNVPWASITQGSVANGPGTVQFAVEPNPSANPRSGTLTIAGQTFGLSQNGNTCTFSLQPTSATFGAAGGNDQIQVLASPDGCASPRTATSGAPWATISFGQSGTGAGTVGYSVSANNFLAERTTTLTVAGIAFNVTQAAGSCTYTLTPNSTTIPAAGGTAAINVAVNNAQCSWQASSNASWLTITSGASGTGSGRIELLADVNAATSSRQATLTVGTTTYTVTQSAGCSIAVNPTSAQFNGPGGTGTFQVQTAGSNCTWSATANADFLTLTGTSSGTGNATVAYAVAPNTTGAPRLGSISAGSAGFTVFQGSDCSYTLTPASLSVGAAAGSATIAVTATCPWTAAPDAFITVQPPSGTGNANLLFFYEANTQSQPRQGAIRIGNQTFTLRQDGVPCSVGITPASFAAPAEGASTAINVSAPGGCRWTASTSAAWIRLTNATSDGDGAVAVEILPNATADPRRAIVAVADKTFSVEQAGAVCNLTLTPDRASFGSSGGAGTFNVASICSWTATSNAGWITVTGTNRGTGDGAINYAVARLSTAEPRTAAIRVGTQLFTITQTATPCAFSVSPTRAELPGLAGRGVVQVTGNSTCRWEPTRDGEWLTITGWSNVNGGGTVNYSFAANPGSAARSATIRVTAAGAETQTATLTQRGQVPRIATNGIVHAASLRPGPVSPGQIVTIFGTGLGPSTLANAQLTADRRSLTTSLADVRVLFDGVAAPLVYASATQVAAVVPYGVSGESTPVVVENQGVPSDPVSVPVVAAAPAIFTANASGTGAAAALNQDNSLNTATNAAQRNAIVTFFVTGVGQTRPSGVDGLIAAAGNLPVPVQPVTVQIGGQNAPVLYAGAAPGVVAGVMQVNARIAANAAVGAVPVIVRVGNAQSPAGVTINVR